MGRIKETIYKIKIFFKTSTSGIPFLLWGIAGLSVIVFIFIFRKSPWINSTKLLYLLPLASIWFFVSDLIKTRKLSSPKIHFFLDSVFYIAFFAGIFYLTGGMRGQLFFITLIPAMSAPFFTTPLNSIIFALFLYYSMIAVYFLSGKDVTPYLTGVIILQSIIGTIIIAMIGYFFNKIQSIKDERVEFAEKEVAEKTKELRKTMAVLDDNRLASKRKYEELEKFQRLVVNREVKMLELKEKIRELEEKLAEKTNK